MTEKIYIDRDGTNVELTGNELEAFLMERAAEQEKELQHIALLEAKESAKQSAIAKLIALGLTEEEIGAL
jgi:DNA-binding NarL/FixJ family response regulator